MALNKFVLLLALPVMIVALRGIGRARDNKRRESYHNVMNMTLHENMKRHQIECVDESLVSPNNILKLFRGDGWRTTDVGLKKWVLCLLVKSGLMTQQGVFRMDKALSYVTMPALKDDVERFIDSCLPRRGMLPYELAFTYVACVNRDNPTGFYLI